MSLFVNLAPGVFVPEHVSRPSPGNNFLLVHTPQVRAGYNKRVVRGTRSVKLNSVID